MAQITMTYAEASLGRSPRLCMRCGEKATTTREKVLSWKPSWVVVLIFLGLLPYLIAAALSTKKMRLVAPLCDRHANHWSLRTLIAGGGFLALMALVFITINAGPGKYTDSLWAVLLVGFLVWLFGIVGLNHTAIRPVDITERDMTVTGVSPAFAEAVCHWRKDHPPELLQVPIAPAGSSTGILLAILGFLMLVALASGGR